MFGLFGKGGFDSEISRLEEEQKAIGARLVQAMQAFDLRGQMNVMDLMLANYVRRIDCCKKYGKFELIEKLEAEQKKLQALRG
jgi:hypothetical protein